MRPRKGTSPGKPSKPEINLQPSDPEESERRKEFFESRRPRKKVLILDKEEKDRDRPESGEKKIFRTAKNGQTGRSERPSSTKRKTVGSPQYPVRKRRLSRDSDAPARPAGSPRDAERKRRPYRDSDTPGRSEGSSYDTERKRQSYGASQANDRPRPSFKKGRATWEPGTQKKTGFRKNVPDPDLIRLNRFIANAGICSRREADELIRAGAIRVNGKIVTAMGVKVSRTDKIQYGDQTLRAEPMVYVLLNKPKGYITTVDDPDDRKTVMTLVKDASRYRIYPVGRLDRNTTGLLLFTNDGELAKKLTHPRYRIDKLYHVELDKNLSKNDLLTIGGGLELEDGFIKVDEIAWVAGADSKKEVGIQLHSGKNHIVRRIFEKLGYDVVKLDRVIFAGLTKKDLPRGHWRHLSKEEVNRLKRSKNF